MHGLKFAIPGKNEGIVSEKINAENMTTTCCISRISVEGLYEERIDTFSTTY
jgi:hypothetical protein